VAVPASSPSIPIAPPIEEIAPADVAFDDEGVFGGIEGGVPGGVNGGVVGGLPDVPPSPPPPPAAPRAPIRTGGALQPPALITRVPPVYPPIAVSAKVAGMVILEATGGRDGRVEEVRLLRSVPLLDNPARDAVLQWEYAPLLLNGKPERFILTVTLSFNLT
jgi:protein TonB